MPTATKNKNNPMNRRLASGALALAAALLGIGSKFYNGPATEWVQHYGGGMLYEIVWISFVALLLPRERPWRIALAVLLATSAIEILQLWHPPLLQAIRATFVGHALLGNTFSWWDFPHYIMGSGLGYSLLIFINKIVPIALAAADPRTAASNAQDQK